MKQYINFRYLILIAAMMGLQYACSISGDDEFVDDSNTLDNVLEMIGTREPVFDVADTSPPPHGTVVRFPAIDILTNAEISVERVVQLNVPLSGIDMSVFELSDGRTIKNIYWPERGTEPAYSMYGVYLSATALSDGLNPFYDEEFLRRQPLLVSTESETGYGYGCVTADVQDFADIGFPSPSINTSVELVSTGTVQSGWVLCAGPENAVNQLVVSWANNPDHPDFASPLWRPLRILGQGDGVLLPLFTTFHCNVNSIECSLDMGESYVLEDGTILEDYVGPAVFHLSSMQTSIYGNGDIGVEIYSTVDIPDEELMSACSTIPVPEGLSGGCSGQYYSFDKFKYSDIDDRGYDDVFFLRSYSRGLVESPGGWDFTRPEHSLSRKSIAGPLSGGNIYEARITEPTDTFWVELVARTKDNQFLTVAIWQLPVPQYLVRAIDTSLVCSQTECALSAQEVEDNDPNSNVLPRAPVPVIQPDTQAAGVTFGKYVEYPEVYELYVGDKNFWDIPASYEYLLLSVDCVPVDGFLNFASGYSSRSSCRSLRGLNVAFPSIITSHDRWGSEWGNILGGVSDAGVLFYYKTNGRNLSSPVRPTFLNRNYMIRFSDGIPSGTDMKGAFIVMEETGPIYNFVGE